MQSSTPSGGPSKLPASPETKFNKYAERVTAYAGREIQNISSKDKPKLVSLGEASTEKIQKDSTQETVKDKTENFSSNVFKMLGNYFLLSNEKRLKPETKQYLNNVAIDVQSSGHTLLAGFIKTVQAGIDILNSWRFKEEPTEEGGTEGIETKTRNAINDLLETRSKVAGGPESSGASKTKKVRFEDEVDVLKSSVPVHDKEEDKSDLIIRAEKQIQPNPRAVEDARTQGGETPVVPERATQGVAEVLKFSSNSNPLPIQDYDAEEETKELEEESESVTQKSQKNPDSEPTPLPVQEATLKQTESAESLQNLPYKEEDRGDLINIPYKEEDKSDLIIRAEKQVQPNPGAVEDARTQGGEHPVVPERATQGLAEMLKFSSNSDPLPIQDYDAVEQTKELKEESESVTQKSQTPDSEPPPKSIQGKTLKPNSSFSRLRINQNPSMLKKAFGLKPKEVEGEENEKSQGNEKEEGGIV